MTSEQVTLALGVLIPLVVAMTTWIGLQVRQLQATIKTHSAQLNGPTLVMNDRIAALERAVIALAPTVRNRRSTDQVIVQGIGHDTAAPPA